MTNARDNVVKIINAMQFYQQYGVQGKILPIGTAADTNGSGIFIAPNLILTAAHVVEDCKWVSSHDGVQCLVK